MVLITVFSLKLPNVKLIKPKKHIGATIRPDIIKVTIFKVNGFPHFIVKKTQQPTEIINSNRNHKFGYINIKSALLISDKGANKDNKILNNLLLIDSFVSRLITTAKTDNKVIAMP